MAYTALYRKWRPQTFDEVRGQDPIVRTLKNQVLTDHIGHAYLFCGTRGTGKTSIAKILARAVNCEHPVDGSPCGTCPTCRKILAGSSLNVVELDAASNNSVEDIRQILEQVQYPPTEGKYRVFIIDEVHMLSAGAFNALLKTLEEPPAYVIFILATTEVNKIPITILSRCQRYDFHRISVDTIAEHLGELADAEKIDAEPEALRYIARVADGSMRDALSLLDQCAAFHFDEKLTYDNVLDELGAVDNSVFAGLLDELTAGDARGALRAVDSMIVNGREPAQMLTDFIWYLRNALLLKEGDDMADMIGMSRENADALKAQADRIPDHTLMRYIRVLSETQGSLRLTAQKRIPIEIALIRLTRPEMEESTDALRERVDALERKLNALLANPQIPAGAARASGSAGAESADTPQDDGTGRKEEAEIVELHERDLDALRKIRDGWDDIIADPSLPGSAKAALRGARIEMDAEGRVRIFCRDRNLSAVANRAEILAGVEAAVARCTGVRARFRTETEADTGRKIEYRSVADEVSERLNWDGPIEDEDT